MSGCRPRLSQKDEALSPRVLRRTLQELQAIIDPRVSEVEGGRRAMAIAAWYEGATAARRRDLWMLMSEQFVANPQKVKAAQAQFAAAVGTPEEAVAEVRYRRATVSPRRRLLQRFSVYPGGIQFLVDMRAEMQPSLKADKRLLALDVEMEYMFSTWFDVGFLDLRRITWDSPASLIEKLIKYEAVHDIKGLGRREEPARQRPALLRLLPPAAARSAADLRGGRHGRAHRGRHHAAA